MKNKKFNRVIVGLRDVKELKEIIENIKLIFNKYWKYFTGLTRIGSKIAYQQGDLYQKKVSNKTKSE